MLKHSAALLLFALIWPLSAGAGAPKQIIGYLQGEITVAADGHVKSVELKKTKSETLEAFFASQIKRWEFHPVMVNGVPADTVAPFDLTVLATFSDDHKIQKIEFREIHIGKSDIERQLSASAPPLPNQSPVRYPEAGLRNGLNAEVRVAVEIGADGRVKQAGVYDLGLVNAGSRNDRRVRDFAMESFGKNAVEGVSKWIWPPEALAYQGCTGGCIRLVSVKFEMVGRPAWSSYAEQAVAPPVWASQEGIKSILNKEQSRYVQFKTDPSDTSINVDI